MSALRESVRISRLKIILIATALAATFTFAVDVSRKPEKQIIARAYVGLVHGYQIVGRPLLKGIVACRFRPTCSDYSIQAVQRHGLVRGLALTIHRLRACKDDVPMGTVDVVP